MNRYLAITAAAFLGSTTGALAGHVKISFQNYCDVFDISWTGVDYDSLHDWTPCAISSISPGFGIEGKTRGLGRHVTLSDYYKGDANNGYHCSYDLQLPFRTGKLMTTYCNGRDEGSTPYIVDGPARAGGHRTTRDLIEPGLSAKPQK